MKIALLGFPLSGRTTLFDALSGGHAREGVASIPIPDPRFEQLAQVALKSRAEGLHWQTVRVADRLQRRQHLGTRLAPQQALADVGDDHHRLARQEAKPAQARLQVAGNLERGKRLARAERTVHLGQQRVFGAVGSAGLG